MRRTLLCINAAFTVVELVLAIAMIGLQAFVLGPPLINAVKEYTMVWSRRQTLAQARSAMDRMVMEVGLIPSSSQIINISSPTGFQFEYPAGTSITYSLNAGRLQRNGADMADNVGLLEFKYYDVNGNETSNKPSVRTIQIRLTLNAPSNQGTLPLTTTVFLRNTGGHYSNYTSP